MKIRIFFWAVALSILNLSCNNSEMNPLQKAISDNPNYFKEVTEDQKYRVQIIYTQINRDENNKPRFTSYEFGVDTSEYFYPASTVKMPAAFLALEKLHELEIADLDRNTTLRIDSIKPPQVAVETDSTATNGLPSVAHYIRKIFVVSDNDANNRLYEFMGQQEFNSRLHEKGFASSRIVHRLGPEGFPFNFEDNQHTNPFTFYVGDRDIYKQDAQHSNTSLDRGLANEKLGVAHVNKQDELVNAPFDFGVKNYISLRDLHDILKSVMFPEDGKGFNISEADYAFLYRNMSMLPEESDYPTYEKQDNYVKFFIYGDKDEDTEIPKHIRIFNKVGWAYGFLTDISYIVDFENNIEFFLAATIHVNENETYNDGNYQYEEIGLPFFGNLGRVIYEMEKERGRTHEPDLSALQSALKQ